MEPKEKYFASRTEAELDELVALEVELNALNKDGFTEKAAFSFLVAFVEIRKLVPAAAMSGVFDLALIRGASQLAIDLGEPPAVGKTKPKRPGVGLKRATS